MVEVHEPHHQCPEGCTCHYHEDCHFNVYVDGVEGLETEKEPVCVSVRFPTNIKGEFMSEPVQPSKTTQFNFNHLFIFRRESHEVLYDQFYDNLIFCIYDSKKQKICVLTQNMNVMQIQDKVFSILHGINYKSNRPITAHIRMTFNFQPKSRSLDYDNDMKKSLADGGNEEMQYRLGMQLQQGYRIETNLEEGFRYMKMAADQGLGRAISALGSMYLHGTGCKKNEELGLEMLRDAANSGELEAQFNYGIAMLGQNKEVGLEFLKYAADNGVSMAQFYYAESSDRDDKKQYLKMSADSGNVDAMISYGREMLLNRDLNEAEAYFLKASETGNPSGKHAYESFKKIKEMHI